MIAWEYNYLVHVTVVVIIVVKVVYQLRAEQWELEWIMGHNSNQLQWVMCGSLDKTCKWIHN